MNIQLLSFFQSESQILVEVRVPRQQDMDQLLPSGMEREKLTMSAGTFPNMLIVNVGEFSPQCFHEEADPRRTFLLKQNVWQFPGKIRRSYWIGMGMRTMEEMQFSSNC